MPIDLSTYNEEVRQWGTGALAAIKSTAGKYAITHRANSPNKGASVSKMAVRFKLQDGAITRVSIVLKRSLIYTHHGAGRGQGGAKGSQWKDAAGNTRRTNPISLGKAGSGNRRAKPFINDILSGAGGVDELATIAATRLGDAVINNAFNG